MSFMDLIVINNKKVNDKTKKNNESAKETTIKFPGSESQETPNGKSLFGNFGFGKSTPAAATNNGQTDEEHLLKALEIYQNGFDSLNQPGYDFYEYYKSVSHDIANAAIYPMAFTMGSAMDKTITKDKLLQQSDYYLSEIIKVYNDYVTKGNAKKQELITQKDNENKSLVGDLELLKQQLEAIKVQIQDRENKLSAIGTKYEPKINEIDSKLSANNIAKDKIVESIEQVKQGIKTNLK